MKQLILLITLLAISISAGAQHTEYLHRAPSAAAVIDTTDNAMIIFTGVPDSVSANWAEGYFYGMWVRNTIEVYDRNNTAWVSGYLGATLPFFVDPDSVQAFIVYNHPSDSVRAWVRVDDAFELDKENYFIQVYRTTPIVDRAEFRRQPRHWGGIGSGDTHAELLNVPLSDD